MLPRLVFWRKHRPLRFLWLIGYRAGRATRWSIAGMVSRVVECFCARTLPNRSSSSLLIICEVPAENLRGTA